MAHPVLFQQVTLPNRRSGRGRAHEGGEGSPGGETTLFLKPGFSLANPGPGNVKVKKLSVTSQPSADSNTNLTKRENVTSNSFYIHKHIG